MLMVVGNRVNVPVFSQTTQRSPRRVAGRFFRRFQPEPEARRLRPLVDCGWIPQSNKILG